ncbi:transcriptional regulator, AlpA family [Halopseudomonas litoralis]|uniref:Transcriptional regulator, AlpA family n=1 Tax=Halopseudomonas litoralis TaxID=797277 RepID=A0A1H1Y6V5_9GAMM|nr:AlpA family transcriptional regulator [Halopseudomonas litoralis]SDT17167.1 transcriptional regulator, AlpA family [Halopseudomonas litoralis]
MRIIRLKEVMHKTGLARSTVYKYMSEKRFPMTVQLSESSVGWVESEIDDWIEMLISQRG